MLRCPLVVPLTTGWFDHSKLDALKSVCISKSRLIRSGPAKSGSALAQRNSSLLSDLSELSDSNLYDIVV